MNKVLFTISSLCFSLVLMSSCSQEDELQSLERIDTSGVMTKSVMDLNVSSDSIVMPLNEADFSKVERSKILSSGDLWNELYQLNGIEFFIQTKDAYFGKNTLETTGKGTELKLGALPTTNTVNTAQLFKLKFLPSSSGIPYLIYSFKEDVPIGVGQYPNNPRYILYAKSDNAGSLFGFSWDFYSKEKSYYIENQDVVGGGSSPWDIFYYSITANNGILDLMKTTKSSNQEFTIVPNDKFTIESFDFELESARIISSEPVSIRTFTIESGSQPIKKTITVNETKSEEVTYQESSATTIQHSGKMNVGLEIKIIKLGSEYGFSKSITDSNIYGEKSSITRTITDQTEVSVPAYTRAVIDYRSIKHTLDVNYKIKFRGIISKKLIEMRGVWSGIDYTTDSFIVKEYPLGSKVLRNQRIIRSTSNL